VLAHTVKHNILEEFKDVIFVTDNAIILYWNQQDYRPLQVGDRNAILEIKRLSMQDQWFHIETHILEVANLKLIGELKQPEVQESSHFSRSC
jgi:hypothetical protein